MLTIVFIAIWEFFLPESGNRDADLPTLGLAVRRMREQQNMSTDELASATSMTRERIDALENGRIDPTYELLLALAKALGVQVSALVALTEEIGESHEP